MCPGVCLIILTSFHSHGRRELGARNDEHYSDDKPFFPHASEQTHRPSNRRASKTDELRESVEPCSSGHICGTVTTSVSAQSLCQNTTVSAMKNNNIEWRIVLAPPPASGLVSGGK